MNSNVLIHWIDPTVQFRGDVCKEEGDFLRHQLSHSCSFSLSQKFSYSMAALEETPTAPDPIATTSGSGANNNSSNNSSRPSTGSSSKISISLPRCTTSTYLLSTDPTDLSRGADSAVARHCHSSPSSSPSSPSSVFSFSSSPLSSSWLLYIYTSRLPQLIIAMRCLLTQLFLSLTPIWQKDYLHWGSYKAQGYTRQHIKILDF